MCQLASTEVMADRSLNAALGVGGAYLIAIRLMSAEVLGPTVVSARDNL